jgi:trans-aconitate 2-methyltransferase
VDTLWDPAQYQRFGDERSRPFFELLGRVRAENPRSVVDLGCGPGNLTATLAARWPDARVLGVDSSPEMIEAAQAQAAHANAVEATAVQASAVGSSAMQTQAGHAAAGRLSFALGDIKDWKPEGQVDVLVSNAALQWVPGVPGLLARWAEALPEGGWLAFQVPGNFDQPSHAILRELAASDRWRRLLGNVELNRQAADPAEYAALLARAGCEVDAWETTYLHILHGEDPVAEWYKGTGLRPVLAELSPGLGEDFLAEYRDRVREAYPPNPFGTLLPFRRVFVVARRVGGTGRGRA